MPCCTTYYVTSSCRTFLPRTCPSSCPADAQRRSGKPFLLGWRFPRKRWFLSNFSENLRLCCRFLLQLLLQTLIFHDIAGVADVTDSHATPCRDSFGAIWERVTGCAFGRVERRQ